MKRKTFMLLAFITTLSFTMLVGCGDEKTNESTKNTTTVAPTEAKSDVPTDAPTDAPTNAPAPIVKTIGNVDEHKYNMAEIKFEEIVKKLRADGIIANDDTCVTMEGNELRVDLLTTDSDTDLVLRWDQDWGHDYNLTLDFDFVWLEQLCTSINGVKTANYNKDLLLSLLGMISVEPNVLFDTIDKTYFSEYSLSKTEWTRISDCLMMDGDYEYEKFISYKIQYAP